MDRSYWRYAIKDLDRLLAKDLFFEGKIFRSSPPDPEYMEPFELGAFLKEMFSLIGRLTYRLFFNRP